MARTRAQIARKHPAGASLPGTAAPRPDRPRSNGNLVVVAAAIAALFLFWYFHLLTLGQMTQLSDGLTMPDLLVGGYDVTYIERLRQAMDDDARGQLSYLHKTAGTLFPLIFGFAWLLLIQLHTGRRWLRWVLWSPVLLFVVVDLWENIAIDAVLAQPDPAPGGVLLASTLTILRWALLLVSLVAGAVSVFGRGRGGTGTAAGAGGPMPSR